MLLYCIFKDIIQLFKLFLNSINCMYKFLNPSFNHVNFQGLKIDRKMDKRNGISINEIIFPSSDEVLFDTCGLNHSLAKHIQLK